MTGGALAAAAPWLHVRAAAPAARELSADEVRQILLEEAEPGGVLMARATIKPFWFEKEVGERTSPHWPADNVSFDYAHLPAVASSQEPFELTAKVVEQLLAINGLARDTGLPRVLFGLRGCMLVSGGDHATWAQVHRVRATRPNHTELRCLLGVWNTADNSLAVFKASTVPTFDYVEKQVEGALRCNMLPTGLHHYKVGAHKGERQPGAFRQQTPLWVIRATKNPVYAANDPGIEWDDLDGDLPFDNIHAAMLSSQTRPPYFSSCGCQTVAGGYSNGVPTGAWAEFRRAAGLAQPPRFLAGSRAQTTDDDRPFDYVLLTGAEAQLVAAGMGSRLRTLRFGASGTAVNELQSRLVQGGQDGVAQTGIFDWKTLGAVVRWQKAVKLAPTGLIGAEAAKQLGLQWA
jgi:hypothetical protein